MNDQTTRDGQLLSWLDDLRVAYEAALPIARAISQSYELDETTQANLQRFQELVERARTIDQNIRQLSPPTSSHQQPMIRTAAAVVVELIQQLIGLCNQIESREPCAARRCCRT